MPLERAGAKSMPYTRMKPRVIGGVCEYCGVVNSNYPSEEQYKLCPHFKDLKDQFNPTGELRCTYCPDNADPVEVVKKADMKVHEHPDKPNVWIAVCDSYNCVKAHENRFVRNS